jgi:hypothetical protein
MYRSLPSVSLGSISYRNDHAEPQRRREFLEVIDYARDSVFDECDIEVDE